jgi:NAD(P)H-flavin reductase
MNRRNLYIFAVDHLAQLAPEGRGVVIVRGTPLADIIKEFDTFLTEPDIAKVIQYTKEESAEHPNMVVYLGKEKRHLVFGTSEEGWKGDYGLTHTDFVVSVH